MRASLKRELEAPTSMRSRMAKLRGLTRSREAMHQVLLDFQKRHAESYFVIEQLREELSVLDRNIAHVMKDMT